MLARASGVGSIAGRPRQITTTAAASTATVAGTNHLRGDRADIPPPRPAETNPWSNAASKRVRSRQTRSSSSLRPSS